jgi:dTDP-4-dehydrorhamnose reductase
MNYTVSENGKYFYKVGKDGKKTRISKEEYVKKTKPRKSKKVGGGNVSELEYVIIIGKTGNLSPEIQKQLSTLNQHELYVFGSTDYNLTKTDGINSLCNRITEITTQNINKKGAVIFVSAERDPAMFGHCQNNETYTKYITELKTTRPQPELQEKREQLINLNINAPIAVFTTIKDVQDIVFVYISTIYVFKGDIKPSSSPRTEDIENAKLDFIEVAVDLTDNDISALFQTHGKNLYAYGKRYVELKLNDIVTENKAKVVILRMDGITPESPQSFSDGTFLLTLENPLKSFNVSEIRYPVFPSQISNVIIGAINKQTERIKVYHVAGTEKTNGVTKAEMILNIKEPEKYSEKLFKYLRTLAITDRNMDDKNAIAVSDDYAGTDNFMEKLKNIYKNIGNNSPLSEKLEKPGIHRPRMNAKLAVYDNVLSTGGRSKKKAS